MTPQGWTPCYYNEQVRLTLVSFGRKDDANHFQISVPICNEQNTYAPVLFLVANSINPPNPPFQIKQQSLGEDLQILY